MPERIQAQRVRYIKLGKGGCWEAECLREGIVRIGYQTQRHFEACRAMRWPEATARYEAENPKKGAATSIVNQIRALYEDDGRTLWITFHGRKMWWTFVDPASSAELHEDGRGTFRRCRGGWSHLDVAGQPLLMDSLSGSVTKVAGYQRTVCDVKDADYVLRRINAERRPEVERAEILYAQLQEVVGKMMRLLTPKDFELLVDLVFAASGWRRLGIVGGTEKTVDMELLLPSTGERAFIQVKSATTQREFDEEYREVFEDMVQFGRMFFAFHTGRVECDLPSVTLLGPDELAALVMEAGLVSWLIRKVS